MDEQPLTHFPAPVNATITILLCGLLGMPLFGLFCFATTGQPLLAFPLGVILFYRPIKDRLNRRIDRLFQR